MKVLIFVAVVVAAAEAASVVYQYPGAYIPSSAQFHSQDVAGNYAFGYNEGHLGSAPATYRREVGDASGKKIGSYGQAGADGKVSIVDYIADAGGYRANIKTTQKQVKPAQAPADVTITEAKVEQVPVHQQVPVSQFPFAQAVAQAPGYYAPYYYGQPAGAYRLVY